MSSLADLQIYDLSPAGFLARLHDALTLYTVAMGYSPDVISYRAQPWRDDTRRPGWQAVGAIRPSALPGCSGNHADEIQGAASRGGGTSHGHSAWGRRERSAAEQVDGARHNAGLPVGGRDTTQGRVDPEDELVGFAYAYKGSADLPWHQHVARAAQAIGPAGQLAAHMLTNYVELTEIHVRPGVQGHGLGDTLLRRLMHGRSEPYVLLSTPEVDFEANRAWRLYRRLGFVDVIRNMKFPGDARPFAILGRALPLPMSRSAEDSVS